MGRRSQYESISVEPIASWTTKYSSSTHYHDRPKHYESVSYHKKPAVYESETKTVTYSEPAAYEATTYVEYSPPRYYSSGWPTSSGTSSSSSSSSSRSWWNPDIRSDDNRSLHKTRYWPNDGTIDSVVDGYRDEHTHEGELFLKEIDRTPYRR